MIAIAGSDYECLFAKIGSNGMVNDEGVWSKSRLHEKLTDSDQATSYVFLDDDVFTLKLYMIKAYPPAKFNTR